MNQHSPVTPAEHDLPLIISVDDHILEPRDLWQRELPAERARPWPAGVAREGQARVHGRPLRLHARRSTTAHWCDLWLFDDLVVADRPAARRRPASRARSSGTSRPSTRTSAPATYDQTARLADMDANHVEVAINYPNTFPRFSGQGFAERERQGARPRLPPDLQRLDDRRVVRRRRARAASSR